MFNSQWNGLPDEEFLETFSSGLENLRSRLYNNAFSSENLAGYLSKLWTEKLSLSRNVAVYVGAFDAP